MRAEALTTKIVTLVDTPALLAECNADISKGQDLAVDLEGVDLCREGTLCLLQVLRRDSNTIWVVDVTVLGDEAFQSVAGGTSLKSILESQTITKVSELSPNSSRQLFYDCRHDIDALWNLHVSSQ